MGIYTNNFNDVYLSNNVTGNDTFESLMESSFEAYDGDDFEQGSLDAISDVNENYSMIMTAIGIGEASYFERTGNEMIYTEGVLSDFASKVKNFLKKIWEKIKSIFKRAIQMFDAYNMQDKAFVKKYRKEIFTGKDLSDFKFKGYEFENLRTKYSQITGAMEKCETATAEKIGKVFDGYTKASRSSGIGDFKDSDDTATLKTPGNSSKGYNDDRESTAHSKTEHFSDIMEAVRGEILAGVNGINGDKFTAEEFRKEVKEWLHDGNTEKEELDKIEVHTIANWLVGSKETKKTIETAFKSSKKAIDTDVKNLESRQKTNWNSLPTTKQDNDTNDTFAKKKDIAQAESIWLSHLLRLSRETKECLITLDGLLIAALKECSRQYKSCLVKIMHYNPKNEAYTESYGYSSYDYSNNFLSGVELK